MGMITDKEMGAKANGTDQWLIDPAPRGSGRFMGRITAAGERTFYFRYTTSTGQRDTLPIGPYDAKGKVGHFTLSTARQIAASWAQVYRSGARDLRHHLAKVEEERQQTLARENQASEVADQQAAQLEKRRLTVRQVFERWASTELKPHIGGDGKRIGRRDGGQYVRDQFERRIFPALGEVAIKDVRKPDLLAILDSVKAEGKLRTTNMLLADLKQMFRFAAEREIIEHSPIELINKRKVGGKDVKRDRFLTLDELAALVRQLPAARLSKRTELGIWIILATGCRIGELMGAAWSGTEARQQELQSWIDTTFAKRPSEGPKLGFVDLEARTWYLPTTKNQRDHTIHLSGFAIEQFNALAALRQRAETTGVPTPWIFPADRVPGPVCIKSFSKQLADRQTSPEKRLKNRSKAFDALALKGGRWTAHDLRRTTSTMMSQLGVTSDVINECENHIKQGMSAVYIQDRREAEQVKAYDAVGQRLADLVALAAKT
jgi:integrase